MKKKRWIDVLVIFFIMIVSGVIRMIYALHFMQEVTASDSLLQRTWVTGNDLFHNLEFTIDDIYAVCLSYAMLFFGNKAIVGVGVNILLQLFSILFIYLSIRTVSDVWVSAIPTLMISCLPMYIVMVSNVSSFSLVIAAISLAIMVVLLIIKGFVTAIYKVIRKPEMVEEDKEVEKEDDGIDYLSEEQLSSDDYGEEEADWEEDDDEINEEPVVYLENIGQNWDTFSKDNILTEHELGALTDEKESTLSHLRQLEEKYQKEESAECETASEMEEHEQNHVIEEKTLPIQQIAEKQAEKQVQKEKESEKKGKDTSLDSELDFSHYDIDDMTGMDFYDIE